MTKVVLKCPSCGHMIDFGPNWVPVDLSKPKTNADRIREMDDVCLSKFLCAIVSPPGKAVNCNICLAQDYCRMGQTGFLYWLKQEVESNDS